MEKYDELILTNDSCFAPLTSFDGVFKKLDSDTGWDFCGITKHYDAGFRLWFLNSYFLVFKKRVFTHNAFIKHIESVTPLGSVDEVICRYEIPFTSKLMNAGFKCKCLTNFTGNVVFEWRDFIKSGGIFIKKRLFSNPFFARGCGIGWRSFLKKHTSYDISLIEAYLSVSAPEFINFKDYFNLKFVKDILPVLRKKLFKINFKKTKKIIVLFGLRLYYKDDEYYAGNDKIEFIA